MKNLLFPSNYFRAAAIAFIPAFLCGLFFLGHSVAWGFYALLGAVLTVGFFTWYVALCFSEENRKSAYIPSNGGWGFVLVPVLICFGVFIGEMLSK